MNLSKNKLFILKLIFSLSIILFLIYDIGIASIYQTLLTVDLKVLLLSIFPFLFLFIIGAKNLEILLKPINSNISFKSIYRHSCLSWALGLFTPSKLGELSLIYFLKTKEDINLGEGLAVALIDKLVTLFTLFCLSGIGFLMFFTNIKVMNIIFVTLILSTILPFLILSAAGRSLIKKFILKKYAEDFTGFSKTLFGYRRFKKTVLLNVFLTFIKWFLTAFVIYLLFLSFDTYINFITILFITTSVIVISLLPISLSGLGIGESAAVFLYSQIINVHPPIILSVYLILRLLGYLMAIFFIILYLDEWKL